MFTDNDYCCPRGTFDASPCWCPRASCPSRRPCGLPRAVEAFLLIEAQRENTSEAVMIAWPNCSCRAIWGPGGSWWNVSALLAGQTLNLFYRYRCFSQPCLDKTHQRLYIKAQPLLVNIPFPYWRPPETVDVGLKSEWGCLIGSGDGILHECMPMFDSFICDA